MFNIGIIINLLHELLKVVQGLCLIHIIIATVNVFRLYFKGLDGLTEVCENDSPILFSALSRNIHLDKFDSIL